MSFKSSIQTFNFQKFNYNVLDDDNNKSDDDDNADADCYVVR